MMEGSITLAEIRQDLKKSRPGKVPGADQITSEFLKALPNEWILHIQKMFNAILDTEEVPNAWRDVALSMIFLKKATRKIS